MTAVLDPTSAQSITTVCTSAIADGLGSTELMRVRRRNDESPNAFTQRRRDRLEDLATTRVVLETGLSDVEAKRFVGRTLDAALGGLVEIWPRRAALA